METLQDIHKKWSKKCKCELKKTATRAVFGDGNPKAKIIFIGEAPGKNEDLEGRPFIGRAGKFLSEMLEMVNLGRASVDGARHDFAKSKIYITNIVKYRPPNNRDPLPAEKDACREWLWDELNFIKPKLIVFLGRHSMNDFFPKLKISEVHGKLLKNKFKNLKTENFLALYHPAAAMYNGKLKETLIKDFKKIPNILKKI